MNTHKSISIIMPLYNSEKYLIESLESVKNQTYTDYELICINDGSTDATLDIVKRYAKEDNRIKVYHNEIRKGAAYSRNIGLDNAEGDFIVFFDGDDIYDENLLKLVYCKIVESETDIVVYDLIHLDSVDIYRKVRSTHSQLFKLEFCRNRFNIYNIGTYRLEILGLGTCCKIIKKELIDRYNIRFQNLDSSNDVYFSLMCYSLAESILYLDTEYILYHAREHYEPSRISTFRNPQNVYLALIKYLDDISEYNVYRECLDTLMFNVLSIINTSIIKNSGTGLEKEYYRFLKKSGIAAIFDRLGAVKDCVHIYIINKLNTIIEKDYDEYLKEKDSTISMIIKMKGYFSENDSIIDGSGKFGIWGLGVSGKSICRHLVDLGITDYVCIDTNAQEGECFQTKSYSYPINSPNYVDYKLLDRIYVTIKGETDNIKAEIRKYSIYVPEILELYSEFALV